MDIWQGITLFIPWIRRYFVRRDEIQHIRRLIVKERQRIYAAKDPLVSPPGPSFPFTRHDVQIAIYQGMRRDLSAVLEGRASQLSFDEKMSITSQFGPIDWVTETHKKLPPFQLYMKMFSDWEQLTWLNLPAYDGEIPTE